MKPVRLAWGDRVREVIAQEGESRLDGQTRAVSWQPGQAPAGTLVVEGRAHRVAWARAGDRIHVWCDGRVFEFEEARAGRASSGADHHGGLASPMPGRVRKLHVAAGESVTRGQALLVLEAMKMEHAIRAPKDGVVRRVLVAEGELVDAGVELIELA